MKKKEKGEGRKEGKISVKWGCNRFRRSQKRGIVVLAIIGNQCIVGANPVFSSNDQLFGLLMAPYETDTNYERH